MSLRTIKVDVQRQVDTGDGGGGSTVAWPIVFPQVPATQNFYGRTSQLLRLEQAAHNAQGPGIQTRKQQLFVFRQQPFPDIQVNDRIVTPDGVKYVVQFNGVRRYDSTLQVDTEVIT